MNATPIDLEKLCRLMMRQVGIAKKTARSIALAVHHAKEETRAEHAAMLPTLRRAAGDVRCQIKALMYGKGAVRVSLWIPCMDALPRLDPSETLPGDLTRRSKPVLAWRHHDGLPYVVRRVMREWDGETVEFWENVTNGAVADLEDFTHWQPVNPP